MLDFDALRKWQDFFAAQGGKDEALNLFLASGIEAFLPLITLDHEIEIVRNTMAEVVKRWDYERNKEQRLAEIKAAKTADRIVEIVQGSLSQGLPYKLKELL